MRLSRCAGHSWSGRVARRAGRPAAASALLLMLLLPALLLARPSHAAGVRLNHDGVSTFARPAPPPGPPPAPALAQAHIRFVRSGAHTYVPPTFLGLSMELSHLCYFLNHQQSDPAIPHLMRTVGLTVLRVGGTSEDFARWAPKGRPTCASLIDFRSSVLTRSLIRRFYRFVRKERLRVIWGLNLLARNPRLYAREATYVKYVLGHRLMGLEIGNEPDTYSDAGLRPRRYTELDFRREWDRYRKAIESNARGAPLVGPSTCCDGDHWYGQFVFQSRASSLRLATAHYYAINPGLTGLPVPTIRQLLSAALMRRTARVLTRSVSAARRKRLPFRIDESNSVSAGGVFGVSDSFGAALWGLDYLFTALDRGVAGIDIQEGEGEAPYSPIRLSTGTAQSMYYAMLLFHLATRGSPETIPLKLSSSANVTAYALRTHSGKLRLVVVDKDIRQGAKIHVQLPRSYREGRVLLLRAPSASATGKITLAGSGVAADGTWKPRSVRSHHLHGRSFSISLNPASAALVTFS